MREETLVGLLKNRVHRLTKFGSLGQPVRRLAMRCFRLRWIAAPKPNRLTAPGPMVAASSAGIAGPKNQFIGAENDFSGIFSGEKSPKFFLAENQRVNFFDFLPGKIQKIRFSGPKMPFRPQKSTLAGQFLRGTGLKPGRQRRDRSQHCYTKTKTCNG